MGSRDGVHFERWNEAFLRPGPERPGTWLYGHQYIAWHAVETAGSLPGAPNEMSLYASEGSWYATAIDPPLHAEASMASCLGQRRLKGGELLTKPLTLTAIC